MFYFYKNKHVKKSPFVLLLFALFLACSSPTGKEQQQKQTENQHNKQQITNVTPHAKVRKDTAIYFNTPALIFFRIDDAEINKMKRRSDVALQYELDILFRNFDATAKSARKMLRKKPVKSILTDCSQLYFINKNNDTLYFNRKYEDMIMGEIFYDGKDSLVVIEGEMRLKEVRDYIEEFYNFDIPESLPEDSIYTNKKDSVSIIPPDTVNVMNSDTIR